MTQQAQLVTQSTKYCSTEHSYKPDISRVQQCTINNLHKDLSFLDDTIAITAQEFIHRRDRLAAALVQARVDAFCVEPGYTFQYYANISQAQWEPWEPEERPFLMVVRPLVNESTGVVTAKTSFLAPHFEERRVRMLGVPAEDELDILTWEEHWNPYETLRRGLFQNKTGVLVVDDEMRDYIVRGLDANGFHTVGLGGVVDAVRQQKSPAEIDILRAVNTGTVEAVRKMRPCLVPGLTESEVTTILNNAFLSIGFQLFFNVVLFEENAALPHGGLIAGDKTLTYDTMVLIDVGAHYMGYSSDISRSFFIDPPHPHKHHSPPMLLSMLLSLFRPGKVPRPFPQLPTAVYEAHNSTLHSLKLQIWDLAFSAQTASISHFVPNATAASVDIAARDVITSGGYGKQFTHRVGHGIGIKAHESPYLHKGNTDTRLLPGMTFTSEPGVYIENVFGVRHEDVFLVKKEGEAECLSGRRAKGPLDP